MKRIILFRYHKKPLVCRDRLEQLQTYNPGVKIYGLYGGEESDFDKYQKHLGSYFEQNYCIKGKSNLWKWKNSDLAIRMWFADVGKDIEFNVLHVIEWDILLFAPLADVYARIPDDHLGITALTKLSNVASSWSWVSKEPYAADWRQLLKFVEEKYGYDGEPFASLGPGPSLTRSFLEEFADADVPEFGHDELRLPLYAQILGFEMTATSFYGKWDDPNTEKYFNCSNQEISEEIINIELRKESGKRVFHPFRKRLRRE